MADMATPRSKSHHSRCIVVGGAQAELYTLDSKYAGVNSENYLPETSVRRLTTLLTARCEEASGWQHRFRYCTWYA